MKDIQDQIQVSCEETFTEDMGPADWANEPEMPSTWREAKTGGFIPPEQESTVNLHSNAFGRFCEDAPCCGCCPASSDFELDPTNDDHWTSFNELRAL